MSRRPRFRERLPFVPTHEPLFRWRGREPSRIEGFSDTVFAFALTLLVVALEVPHTFDGFIKIMRDFPAFVACFALLMYFWNAHYVFFRRYALEDMTTRVLNYGILLLILFSAYPLKFLFSSCFAVLFGPHDHAIFTSDAQVYFLFEIYGLGLAAIFLFFALVHDHAWRKRHELRLTATEQIITRSSIWEFRLQIAVCVISVAIALLRVNTWLPGVVYFSLGIVLGLNGWWHGSRARAIASRDHSPPLAA